MLRIRIAADITGQIADVLALHPAVAAAAAGEVMFTVSGEGLHLEVDVPDLPAVLAVLSPAEVLGQITLFASESPLQAAA